MMQSQHSPKGAPHTHSPLTTPSMAHYMPNNTAGGTSQVTNAQAAAAAVMRQQQQQQQQQLGTVGLVTVPMVNVTGQQQQQQQGNGINISNQPNLNQQQGSQQTQQQQQQQIPHITRSGSVVSLPPGTPVSTNNVTPTTATSTPSTTTTTTTTTTATTPAPSQADWNDLETRHLITLRGSMESQFSSTSRNKDLWKQVATRLADYAHYRSWEQCKIKWKNLLSKYKEMRDAAIKSEQGVQSSVKKPWKFWEDMDVVVRERHAVQQAQSARMSALSLPLSQPQSVNFQTNTFQQIQTTQQSSSQPTLSDYVTPTMHKTSARTPSPSASSVAITPKRKATEWDDESAKRLRLTPPSGLMGTNASQSHSQASGGTRSTNGGFQPASPSLQGDGSLMQEVRESPGFVYVHGLQGLGQEAAMDMSAAGHVSSATGAAGTGAVGATLPVGVPVSALQTPTGTRYIQVQPQHTHDETSTVDALFEVVGVLRQTFELLKRQSEKREMWMEKLMRTLVPEAVEELKAGHAESANGNGVPSGSETPRQIQILDERLDRILEDPTVARHLRSRQAHVGHSSANGQSASSSVINAVAIAKTDPDDGSSPVRDDDVYVTVQTTTSAGASTPTANLRNGTTPESINMAGITSDHTSSGSIADDAKTLTNHQISLPTSSKVNGRQLHTPTTLTSTPSAMAVKGGNAAGAHGNTQTPTRPMRQTRSSLAVASNTPSAQTHSSTSSATTTPATNAGSATGNVAGKERMTRSQGLFPTPPATRVMTRASSVNEMERG